ncbi:unnamed protein product, partial [Coregonus sp. 'balchen']
MKGEMRDTGELVRPSPQWATPRGARPHRPTTATTKRKGVPSPGSLVRRAGALAVLPLPVPYWTNSTSGGMTRRNTYVCSDRNASDRHSAVIQNGKENSTTSSQRNPGGASTHSISSGTTPPDRLHFPRGTASRSTFHGGQLRERRTATYNGPPASPTLSHDATLLSQSRSRGSTNLFTKLTSKLTR